LDPAGGLIYSPAVFLATLFDFNGVLVDDEAVHLAAFREVLAPLGVGVSEQAYWQRYIGFDDVGAFRAILTDAGRDPTDRVVEELLQMKRPAYMSRARQSLSVFAGAAELVRRRATDGPVGIVSGALRDEVELGLDVLGVRAAVSFIVSAEDTTRCKPDPEGYEKGAQALGPAAAKRGRVLVIEDSVAGVVAAKAAGLTCLAVAHSYPEEALAEAGADLTREKIELVLDDDISALARTLHV
jgi:beta-phosphoglucomutase-like phosphatase (HAD superfamily)